MNTLFQDTFSDHIMLKRMAREIKKEQLLKTIKELECLNRVQERIITGYDYSNKIK